MEHDFAVMMHYRNLGWAHISPFSASLTQIKCYLVQVNISSPEQKTPNTFNVVTTS